MDITTFDIPLDILDKYLSDKAKEVVHTKCYHTAVEVYKNSKNGGFNRKPYLVEFLSVIVKEKPNEYYFEKFIDFINKCVENGDIFYGSLCLPFWYEYPNRTGEFVISFYAVSKIPFNKLNKKYPFFVEEGSFPTFILE
jgi:hypothetical protein